MTSTLGHALLGALARGPQTGYDLSRLLARPVGFSWHARHSQVYPELARLHDAALVRYEVIDGPGPRETKRYEITAAGFVELRRWLGEPTPADPVRDEFLLKVWSMWLVDEATAEHMIEARMAQHAERLAGLEAEAEQTRAAAGAATDEPGTVPFASEALLRRGIAYERMARDWCVWLLGRLRGSGGPGAAPGGLD